MAHIGLDARLTYYRTGGTSTYTQHLRDTLAMLDHQNRYTVFYSRKTATIPQHRFHAAKLWTPSHHRLERLALSVELTRFGLDVLHSPDFIPPYRGAKRHVITVHDLTFIHYPQYLTADSRRYYNDQIQAAVNHADHILTVSESAKRDIVSMLNVPESKITVQLHGVTSEFKPLPPEVVAPILRKHDLPEHYFLFVGTLEPRKNIAGLLDAYAALKLKMPDAPPLVCVGGKGWLIEDTLARAATMPDVILRHDVPYSDFPALYNGACAEILPAFYEGFGMPALEAMACGTIPIVTERSSLPEVVGDVGLLINPDDPATITDAMARVLNADDAWHVSQREAAITRAAAFTWERSARIALSVYQSVL